MMQTESAGTIEELGFLESRRNLAWDAVASVLVVFAGIVAGFGIQRLIPPRAPDWLFLLAVPAPILPLWWWYANRCERRLWTAMEETAELSIGRRIQSLFRDLEPRQYESAVHDVVCDAVARGNLAQTARLAVAPERNAIESIIVPFEARVIDDTDATFQDVEQGTSARDFDGRPSPISYSDVEALRTVRRAWKRLRQVTSNYG